MAIDKPKILRNIEKMEAGGASDSEIEFYIQSEGLKPKETSVTQDIAQTLPAGVARGTAGMFGVGDLGNLAGGAVDFVGGQLGVPPEYVESFKSIAGRGARAVPFLAPAVLGPTIEQNTQAIESVTGPLYRPKTRAGEYAHTVGEFIPNLIAPGTIPQRVVAGVLAPALTSEALGGAFEGTRLESPARIGGALAGGIGGTVGLQALNARRGGVPGMSSGASRVLERNIPYDAEARLASMGPEAFLLEAGEDALGVAQGVAVRPGAGRGEIMGVMIERQAGANQRLARELDAALGPSQVPSRVDASLQAQADEIGKQYQGVLRGGQRVATDSIAKAIAKDANAQAGAQQRTLKEIEGYLYKDQKVKNPQTGEMETRRVLKTDPTEIFYVRNAIDDLIEKIGDQPKALRQAVIYRERIDQALGKSVPGVHALDDRFSAIKRQQEALASGSSVLNTGKTATRPWELGEQLAAMSPAERDMMIKGARAEIDRIVGTNAHDVTKLKQLIQSEGDWNREKLARLFGMDKADRIIATIENEATRQNNYRRVVENSQTAQRLAGMKAVAAEEPGRQSMRDLTVMGAGAEGLRKLKELATGAIGKARRAAQDTELARALTTQGSARDELVRKIREAQAKRARGSTTLSRELTRLMLGVEAATVPTR